MALVHEKIIAAMADVDFISKNNKNSQQGFMFRGIDDVYNSLHETMAKHGIFTTTQVLNERTEERQTAAGKNLIYRVLTIKFTFFAQDGSSVESVVIGEGMDSGDKAANKAMAIAHKYALLQIFVIPTAEQKDPDAESHEVQPLDAREKAIGLLSSKAGEERDNILKKSGGKIDSVTGKWVDIDWNRALSILMGAEI